MRDQLHRYLFEQADVRGEMVQLQECYQQALATKTYPESVKILMGEALAATSLLTALLKFKGDIAIQLQGEGPLTLLAVNGDHKQRLRTMARWQGTVPAGDIRQQMGKGHLVITITPEAGERYQGIVALEKDSLAACLEQYFSQSEQLNSRLWLFADQHRAGGMLLQQLPLAEQQDRVSFEHLEQLTDTVKAEEILMLEPEDILHRLYHQELVRLFDPTSVQFYCGCSKERSLKALLTISQTEIDSLLAEQESINMNCDYCGAEYRFDAVDIAAGRQSVSISKTHH